MLSHLKLAIRTLTRTPIVTFVAVLSLALGIGANSAIFSLFEQMLLRDLPVPEPQRLVNLDAPGPKSGSQSWYSAGGAEAVFSYPMFRDLEEKQESFTGIAAHWYIPANLAYRDGAERGEGMLVSGSYFPVLGIQPALGRLLEPADDQVVGEHSVTVLSYDYWQSRLGGDPGVLDSTIVVNGQSMTVVGVAPRGFRGTTLGMAPDVFVPITMKELMQPGWQGFDDRRKYWAYLFGRLRPGVTMDTAHAELNALYAAILRDVEAPLQTDVGDEWMERFLGKTIVLEDGRQGQSLLHSRLRAPFMILLSITGVVVLIACANIANLLLARGVRRGPELAVRGALGASRLQLLFQPLTESLLLAILGGFASLVVASWTLHFLGSLAPPDVAGVMSSTLGLPVVLFAFALSLVTGLLFGIYPALHCTRQDLITTLRANTGQPSGSRSAARFRTLLVTAQISLSMALLVASGLFARSLFNVSRVDLGVATEGMVTFAISPELNGYGFDESRILFERAEEELAAIPGVTGVTLSIVPILAGQNWGTDVSIEGVETGPGINSNSRLNKIGPGYFGVMGIPLLAGREFDQADVGDKISVAVVNEAFLRKFDLDPRKTVGKWMSDQGGGASELPIQIVGIVQDSRHAEVKAEVPPMFFTPYRQQGGIGAMTYYVRTASAPGPVVRAIPGVVGQLDPNLPVENLRTMDEQVVQNVSLDRMISALSMAFGALATLLAAVGLYGVLAFTVAQRTREFGLRMALGANGSKVRGMVLKQVGSMVVVGGVVGAVAALLLGRGAQSLLYGMEGHDPLVFALAAVVVASVALGAALVPAMRASKVDPLQALKYE